MSLGALNIVEHFLSDTLGVGLGNTNCKFEGLRQAEQAAEKIRSELREAGGLSGIEKDPTHMKK